MRLRVGSLEALQTEGRLLTKAGGHGVCVFWHEGRAYALDSLAALWASFKLQLKF